MSVHIYKHARVETDQPRLMLGRIVTYLCIVQSLVDDIASAPPPFTEQPGPKVPPSSKIPEDCFSLFFQTPCYSAVNDSTLIIIRNLHHQSYGGLILIGLKRLQDAGEKA